MKHAKFPPKAKRQTCPISPGELERLLHYMPICAVQAENQWARDFASDMAKRAHWKNWQPTAKQIDVMRRMVSDLFSVMRDECDDDLIE